MSTTRTYNPEAAIREYLAMVRDVRGPEPPAGFHYRGIEDLLLREGRVFRPVELPRRYQRHAGPMKACFENTQRLVRRFPHELHYAEGYAVSSLFPVLHAWAVDRDGQMVDPTWEWRAGDQWHDPEAGAAIGLVFPTAVIVKPRRSGQSLSLLDDWTNRWPYLREPWTGC